jgi:hypothetical protein
MATVADRYQVVPGARTPVFDLFDVVNLEL